MEEKNQEDEETTKVKLKVKVAVGVVLTILTGATITYEPSELKDALYLSQTSIESLSYYNYDWQTDLGSVQDFSSSFPTLLAVLNISE